MERNMVLAVIFSAAAVVGAIETVYQVYQLTVIDAAARGLKHPKLWGLLAANGNNSSGLLLYLIGRRNYPVNLICIIGNNIFISLCIKKHSRDSMFTVF